MSALIVRVPPAGAGEFLPPTRPDGTPFEMYAVYDGGWTSAWADAYEDIVAAIIGGEYETTGQVRRMELRIEYLSLAQVREMARLSITDQFQQLTEEQRKLWLGEWSGPVAFERWDSKALVLPLMRQWYRPFGVVPAPEGNILWLDAATDQSFVESLIRLGAIEFGLREEGQ